MINPKELRIGNLFSCNLMPGFGEQICEVIWLTKEGIENQYGGFCPYHASNPIPLTSEILERCGFHKSVAHNFWTNDGEFTIWYDDSDAPGISGDFRFQFHDSLITIQYVHELQNLYHSLTGERKYERPANVFV